MIICDADLIFLSNAVTGKGRPDHVASGKAVAVAWEHMRIKRVRFANATAFAGNRYRSRAFLPIVSRFATVQLDRV